jgi:hypothetical protein
VSQSGRKNASEKVSMKRKLFLTGIIVLFSLGVFYISILVVAGLMSEKFPVKLPGKSLYTDKWSESAYASGTWTIDNAESGAPFQTSEISCSRQSGICDVITAEIVLDTLRVSRDSYRIQKWDQNEIVSTNDAPVCFRYVYSINRLTEQVTGFRIKKPQTQANSNICNEWSNDQLRLRLVDGSKWYWEQWDKSKPNLFLLGIPGIVVLVVGLVLIWRRRSQPIAA